MTRFAKGVISGVTAGLFIGASIAAATTDSKDRRRMIRDGKRAMRKAGHYFHDMFDHD
ncbi:MAG: hypothetical protein FWF78_05025 [Defluviitaleaceae bacterium]|nr:hypothetical protein [Defluviitaleaceae bacterium]